MSIAHARGSSNTESGAFRSIQSHPTNRSTHVRYTALALKADRRYNWRLRYQSSTGHWSEWAKGSFRTGLMPATAAESPFDGVWIGSRAIHMNQLRREFTVPASLQTATVSLSGLGLYELYVNGQPVDATRRLDPAWTEYGLRVLYVSFDVTQLLKAGGMNCVGVMLGNGWYAPEQWGIWSPVMVGHPEYGPPRLLLQLNLHLSNGSVLSLVSDEQWMGREGPIIHDGIYWSSDVAHASLIRHTHTQAHCMVSQSAVFSLCPPDRRPLVRVCCAGARTQKSATSVAVGPRLVSSTQLRFGC